MGEVWKARMLGVAGFQRTVVVKRILPEHTRNQELVDMFLREAHLSARLMHPNIVQVYDLGQNDAEYFMAMEYVRGTSLIEVIRALLRRPGPSPKMPIGFGVVVVRDVCRALGYAHSLVDENMRPLRIVHRDVSPANVMISDDGVIKLLDFGIAKALGQQNDERTRTGIIKGKFSYMSPQQAAGEPIDHRADLFAAGVILHELLAGQRLFKGDNDLETLSRVKSQSVEPPSKHSREIPAQLDAICLKALERDPERRYQSGEEMAEALDAVAAQLRWSTGSVGALMRELFPHGHGEVTGETSEPDKEHDTIPSEERSVGPTVSDRQPTTPFTPQRRVMSPWLAAVTAIAAASSVAAIVTSVAMSRGQHEPQLVASAPAPPRDVTVQLRSTPPGAEVLVDGATRGVTPLSLTVPRSQTPLAVSVRRQGYQPYETRIVPDANQRFEAVLVTTPPAPPPPIEHAPPAPHPTRRPAQKHQKIDLDSATF